MEKMQGIYERICPMTIMVNVGAIGMSVTDVEVTMKILSYVAAFIWTSVKIAKEIKFWDKQNKS